MLIVVITTMSFLTSYGQNEISAKKLKELQSQNLVFLWPGLNCPEFNDTHKIYGFRIVCAGTVDTRELNKNNKRVVKKLERVYGKEWFHNQIKYFVKSQN